MGGAEPSRSWGLWVFDRRQNIFARPCERRDNEAVVADRAAVRSL